MEFPICSTSLGELWSFRWHQSLKPTWLNFPLREVRLITERFFMKKNNKNAKRVGIMAAGLSVFIASGLLHEYLAYVNTGLSDYKEFVGYEFLFFTLHGVAVLCEKFVEKACQGQSWTKNPTIKALRRAWTLGFLFVTFPLFLRGFLYWDSWYPGTLTPYQPKMIEWMHEIPGMRNVSGSLF